MGASREPRDSEKTFSLIWSTMRHLTVCVWYPLKDDAIEHIDELIILLEKMKSQILNEK